MCIYEYFNQSVINFPTNNALFCKGVHYTYSELNELTLKIMRKISTTNTIEKIGVVTGDDVFQYASILAISGLGGTYVPLNHKNPSYRNIEIIEQCGITLVLSSEQFNLGKENINIIGPNDFDDKFDHNFKVTNRFNSNYAYILFTSGSTGKPKGVPITNKNLINFVDNVKKIGLYEFYPTDRFLQMFELTFDLSVFSYLIPFSVGACSYVIPDTGVVYLSVYKYLEDHEITVALKVPSVISYLAKYFDEINLPKMRHSIFCGEALYYHVVSGWEKCIPNATVDNVYGPTEATIFFTTYRITDNLNLYNFKNDIVPIGKPMGDLKCILIKDQEIIQAKNVFAELCLIGDQVANEYFNNEVATQNSFVYNNSVDAIYYRTGDLCAYDDFNDIIFIGRVDNQIKVNGYRVELGDIESCARKINDGKNAIAIYNESSKNIYIVLEGLAVSDKFMEELKMNLPPYMWPSKSFQLDQFPLNLSGKIDRNKIKSILIDNYGI